jgi:hypothetical protein
MVLSQLRVGDDCIGALGSAAGRGGERDVETKCG